MKAIFSYLDLKRHYFCDVQMAKLANSYAQKQGYKTCLYTDQKGYNTLTPYINYDEVILFNETITSKLNPKIWSLGKILAMSMVGEPFMHIDFDMFILKPLQKETLNKDFFAMYSEPWLFKIPSYKKQILEIYNLYPNPQELNFNNFDSYNFALAGGQKFKEINFVCNRLIEFSINSSKEIDKFENSGKPVHNFFSNSWSRAVIFEQIMIQNLLSKIFNINIYSMAHQTPIPYYENMDNILYRESLLKSSHELKTFFIKDKLIHLHGQKKNKLKIFIDQLKL